MNWIETIYLRANNINAYKNILSIAKQIKILLADGDHVIVKTFINSDVPSDFLVLLDWKCNDWDFDSRPLKSIPGMRLAESLKQLGMVNHSTFMEDDVDNDQ